MVGLRVPARDEQRSIARRVRLYPIIANSSDTAGNSSSSSTKRQRSLFDNRSQPCSFTFTSVDSDQPGVKQAIGQCQQVALQARGINVVFAQ